MSARHSNRKPKILSAGITVMRRENDAWQYLLLRAYRYWDFPKGKCEKGEQPLAAALRETDPVRAPVRGMGIGPGSCLPGS